MRAYSEILIMGLLGCRQGVLATTHMGTVLKLLHCEIRYCGSDPSTENMNVGHLPFTEG